MTWKLHHTVRQWLRWENADDPRRAERALREVFASLPPESVPAGFADRLMLRAGMVPASVPAAPSWMAFWGLRAVVSLCLVLVTLFLLVIPSYLPSLLGILNPNRATEIGVGALMSISHQLGSGLVIWRALSAAGSILSSNLSSPQYLLALGLAALLSIAALRVLHQVIATERSSRYVGSI